MSLPPPPSPPARTPGRGLRIVLVISLALNLLVVGLIVGLAVSRGGPGGSRGFELGLGPLVTALAPEDRRAIAEDLRARPGVGTLRSRPRRALTEELADALAAVPFDRAAVERLMTAQAARLSESQALARAAFLDRIEAIGPEARAAYANRLRRDGGRGPDSRNR